MKYLKMLGLAAVAAMALMAFVGTGTASAAGGILCESEEEECPSKWNANAHMTFSLKTGAMTKLTATGGQTLLQCTASGLTGKVLSAGTAAARARVEVKKEWLTWGGCSTPITTVTSGELEFEYINAPETKGTVFAKNLVITAEVLGVHCYYKAGTGTDIGVYTPGAEGKDGILAVNALTAKENSAAHPSPGLCPANVVWDAEYTLGGTTPLYIKGS